MQLPNINKHQQRGAMTILISLIFLVLITLISLYTAKTVNMEQKIASNDARSKMAFEAAEAGLEAADAYASVNGFDADVTDDLVFEADGSVSTDGAGASASKTFSNGSTVTVSLAQDGDDYVITSVGTSDDGVATRTIEQMIGKANPLATTPNSPFTARAGITVGGSATIHNPETATTIVTGSLAKVSGGTINTRIPMYTDNGNNNYPACDGGKRPCDDGTLYVGCPGTEYVKCAVQDGASKSVSGDIIEGETTLAGYTADEFFEATFGVTKAVFKASVATLVIDGADFGDDYPDGANKAVDQIIWVDGNVSSSATVGCTETMGQRSTNQASDGYGAFDTTCKDAGGTRGGSIVVVDGDYDTNGAKIIGLLYVIGDVDTNGNPEVHGAMIVEGQDTQVTGSLDIWYDSGILANLENLGSSVAASGSWKDF